MGGMVVIELWSLYDMIINRVIYHIIIYQDEFLYTLPLEATVQLILELHS